MSATIRPPCHGRLGTPAERKDAQKLPVISDESLSDLNPDQRRAVTHTRGPLKIVAGAGTGKTGTLTRRFAYLVEQGAAPDRILALTFSRRAAAEFRERVLKLLDISYRRLWISTYHGFCLRVLRDERARIGAFTVLSQPEHRRIIARVVREDPHAASRRYYLGDSGATRLVADAVTLISRTKDEGISLTDFIEYADQRDVERLRELANVYLSYEELCRHQHKLDFGDLGFRLVQAFEEDNGLLRRWRGKFDHIMVDEFQDTNEAQWRLLTLLAPPPEGNLTVVGDDAQAIYGFRGASSNYFSRFQKEYPGADSIVLATNYRSDQRILDAAYALIDHNHGHEVHHLGGERGIGEPVRIAGFADEDREADYVARSILRLAESDELSPADCAVLCRSVKQSAPPLIRAFSAYGIPFYVRGYDPALAEALDDLTAVLRCIEGRATWVQAARTLMRRHIALAELGVLPEDALARCYAGLLGPNQQVLQDVPPLDAITYGRVVDWLDGADWRPLAEVRAEMPNYLSAATAALDCLEAACVWLRTLPLEGQVYAALAMVGRLSPASASPNARSGLSACRSALRVAHGLSRNGLGIPALIAELGRLQDEDAELGDVASGRGVAVLTLHAAKGLEWPAVFIVGAAAGRLPSPLRLDRAFDLDDLSRYVQAERRSPIAKLAGEYQEEPERERAERYMEEERRLAYVGCTRARDRLTISFARSYDGREAEPSQFLAELQKADPHTWLIDRESDAGIMLPLDVARAVRQQALASLGISGRPVLPPENDYERDGGDVLASVLAAQFTASHVADGVPLRFREMPRPFHPDSDADGSSLTVSFSGVDAYEACPRQYFYAHVLCIQAPMRSAGITLGSKVHDALRALNDTWMATGAPPDDAAVQNIWRATWPLDRATIDAALANPDTRVPWEPGFNFARQVVQGWQRGGAYLRRYYVWERELRAGGAQRVPVALEHRFDLPHGNHRITGLIDCVLATPEGDFVIDYKTGKKSSDLKAAKSLQLAIYQRAWQHDSGAPVVDSGYYFLARDKDLPGRFAHEWDRGKQVDIAHF
ncbi:MAG: ATP-dependent DNA helicase, partial [Chloroflexota bacterium]